MDVGIGLQPGLSTGGCDDWLDHLEGAGSEMPRARTREPRSLEWATLGATIRAGRRALGLTLPELGRGLVSPAHLSNVEGGIDQPSLRLVEQLQARLDLPVGQLSVLYRRAVDADGAGGRLAAVVRQQVVERSLPRPGNVYRHLLPSGKSEPLTVQPLDEVRFATRARRRRTVIEESDVDCTVMGPNNEATYKCSHLVRAEQDGVATWSFWRHNFPGQHAQTIEIGATAGGRLRAVHQYGRSFRHTFTLDQTLARGEVTRIAYVLRVIGPSFPLSAVVASGHEETRQSRVSVTFADMKPRVAWWFQNGAGGAALGQYSPARRLELDTGTVTKTFVGPDAYGEHGIEWEWGRLLV